jgi:predicted nuclease of predicted toxin-antitoxin system
VKFIIGQALSPAVATELNRAGHDAVHVRELRMQAASDEEIFDHAARDDLPQIVPSRPGTSSSSSLTAYGSGHCR